MEARNLFVYRGKELKKGGSFTKDGKEIAFNDSYIIKLDESIKKDSGEIVMEERIIKLKNVNKESKELAEKIDTLKMYDKIICVFDIKFVNTKEGKTILDFILIDVAKPTTK